MIHQQISDQHRLCLKLSSVGIKLLEMMQDDVMFEFDCLNECLFNTFSSLFELSFSHIVSQ